MVVHALRGCGLDPGYLVGGEVRSTGSNAGWGAGEWLVVEADESDRSLLKLAPRIAVLTNAELDHHATYASQRDVDDTFRAFLAMAEHVVLGDEPAPDPLPRGGRPARARRARARRLALQRRRRGGRAAGPGRAQRPQRGDRARRLPRSPGADLAAAAAALADFGGAGPALRAPRRDAGGRARGRRLRAPPDRGPRHDRRRPHARAAPRRRRLPAAPVLAHAPPVPRVRRRARRGRPRRRARRLPRPRARRGLPGRDRPARGGRGRRRRGRPAASPGSRASTRPRRSCAASCATATCC